MPGLVMIAPAPVIRSGKNVILDIKFVEGMRVQQAMWPERMTCILRLGTPTIPFGAPFDPADLPFDLVVLEPDEPIGAAHLGQGALIYASGDDFRCLRLVDLMQPGQKIVYVIEYTHETRLQILMLDRGRGLLGQVKGGIWLLQQERLRRRAFRKANGLQSNGYPAHDLYSPMCRDSMLYLDGRMTPDLFATGSDMAARDAHRAAGGPLRLVFSGRLEPMKGAQDLVPVAQRLVARGVHFTLDIFGTGSLRDDIAADIRAMGAEDRVRLHAPVDFETGLVPFTRQNADIFVGCHRQSDPSCTYLEAMGCGVAVASYDNRMWTRLNAASGAGWGAPLGRPLALADSIAEVATRPADLAERSRKALAFSQQHGFHLEFRRRMDHLARIAG